jgi:hypothetical protein
MIHAARYAIIRFLPFAETEEFANVGVIMFAPTERFFDFRISKKWRRIGTFFEPLERRIFGDGIRAFEEELIRTRNQVKTLLDGGAGALAMVSAQRLFEDVVRTREALFRFSTVRAVMTEAPAAKLNQLFEDYVEHAFATPEYHEGLIERNVRGVLRREGLTQRYRPLKLGTGALQFGVPFADVDTLGRVQRVIKPMHLAHEDPVHILDHGNQWVGRLRHLERVKAMPDAFLLAVTEPPLDNTDRHAAFEEVKQGLQQAGAAIQRANDEQGLLRFAAG